MSHDIVPCRDLLSGEIRQVPIPADCIANLDAHGFLRSFRPDYSKPGVRERVARESFEAEVAANPPRGSLGYRLLALRMQREIERNDSSKTNGDENGTC